jgi:hypothetical protein
MGGILDDLIIGPSLDKSDISNRKGNLPCFLNPPAILIYGLADKHRSFDTRTFSQSFQSHMEIGVEPNRDRVIQCHG